MNEKIAELAKQSGITFSYDIDNDFEEFNSDLTEILEKFAELIVNECATICINENVSALSLDELNSSAFTIQDLATKSCGAELSRIIKKRFGV